MSRCVICREEIGEAKKFMVALEVPYLNLYIHYTCWSILAGLSNKELSDIVKNELITQKSNSITYKNRKKVV